MSDQPIKLGKSIKGRGAVTNHPSRFLAAAVEPQSDDWGDGSDILEYWQTRNTKVQIRPDLTKRLITSNRSPDIPFDQSINPSGLCPLLIWNYRQTEMHRSSGWWRIAQALV